MSYNEETAQRVRQILSKFDGITEKKMFGGLCFLLHGNMVCGVSGMQKDSILFRIDPKDGELLLRKPGVNPMVMKGKAMKGFLYVKESVLTDEKDLEKWIMLSVDFVKTLPKK